MNMNAQRTDANIVGHVVCEGEHVSFATVAILGSTIGTATDETGHYQIVNLSEGNYTLVVSVVGYKTQQQKITVVQNKTLEVNFELEPDVLNLDEVVVSADRGEQKRTEAPVIVNTISPKLFSTTQTVSLGEALNFSPGLRLENNCQNCGFSQVRMNGMDGAHSQILIDSRPIFSGLAGVYGLEMIPTNMIEKIEVVRGGGSVLFGSNAIAGTINLIMKEPLVNSFEAGTQYSLTGVGVDGSGGSAPDFTANANATVVTSDHRTGMSMYGFTRKREIFDANCDSFSEIAPLKNQTIGGRLFHKFDSRDNLSIDFFSIHEDRDGGNMQDYPLHMRDIAEAVEHEFYVAGVSYKRFFRGYDVLNIYASGQYVNRDSYYGAEQSISDYGNTLDKTGNIGINYRLAYDHSSVIFGFENRSESLVDKKLGYPEYSLNSDSTDVEVEYTENTIVSDQVSMTNGVFAQYDGTLGKVKLSLGARFDSYKISDNADEGAEDKTGTVLSPRVSIMYPIVEKLKFRANYSQGYRAPQIFDEDLHIETSGARQVLHENDPDLKQETSHSVMASLDFNGLVGKVYTGLLIEGFYTRLIDAFANEIGEADDEGTVVYTRVNSGGATVQGVNIEFRLKPLKMLEFSSGFTMQTSMYDDEQDEVFNEKEFYRTPRNYGFFALDADVLENLCLSLSSNYTGSMLVPHNDEVLITSDSFFDMGFKAAYDVKINGASLQIFAGLKNILNSYQDDFDTGIDRDPAYIYGPSTPRTVYFGLKVGNLF